MTTNVGSLDRFLRAAVGLGLLYLALISGLPAFDGSLALYGAATVGVIMLIVAVTRICPVYSIFGFKTCGAC